MNAVRPKVLLIDDTPVNLHALSAAFAGTLDVYMADSGAAGLKLAAEIRPDIILLDVMMPEMDGHEVCRRLKANEATECIPVVFVTALGSGEDEAVGLELGAVDYITKPINIRVARQRVLNLVKMERLYRDIEEQCEHLEELAEARTRAAAAAKMAEEPLRQAASVFEHANEGIMITDAAGVILDVNAAFTRITGYTREEVIGQNPRLLNSGRHGPEFFAAMWKSLGEAGHWTSEIWNRRKSGEVFAEMQTISAITDGDGRVQRYVSLFSDITAIKQHQMQLERIAHYDALTQLPNRVLLADRLHQAMLQAVRRHNMLAVVYLDIDGFKAVNDTHGHETGDKLLVELADRMKEVLREGDTLARLGGDEFVAVLLDLATPEDCELVLSRLLKAASETVLIGMLRVQVSASIGVTFYPQVEEIDADQLLRQADQSMYQAKQTGKNRYHLFDTEQDRVLRGRHESIERIREALENREFVLYYQPKVNMRTGEVIGSEALIRWQHPELGLLPPAHFLPLIEDHELIVQVGDWVIENALLQMEAWRVHGLDLPVSVNISGRQLQAPEFIGKLRVALHQHPTVANRLELEVLESSALDDVAQVSQVITDCREMGVHFALDDFGTGYSSLTYLKRLPAQTLKIDQSFVRDMLEDPEDLAILDGVLGLTIAFQRTAIAEGVETPAHCRMLLRMGCEFGQGYAIGRPMPADDMARWIDGWHPETVGMGEGVISRDDMPVLFAIVEHRAWVAALRRYLQGEQATPPVDERRCRLGQWLAQAGAKRYAGHTVMTEIDRLHKVVHKKAGELVDLVQQGESGTALVCLSEIDALRDHLIGLLRQLIDDDENVAV